ncbi:hypothetical protein FTX61_21590 [Nitriliruptoraceae bacterium ZYF776]|nr:hypothetical protein [Profundirhabdus halotolerans]
MTGSRGMLATVASVAVCCGVGWLLVAAGVLGASAGLLSSPELTVAAIAVSGWALMRLVVRLYRARVQETR